MTSTPLAQEIDVTDLDAALAADLDGSFRQKVQDYLEESQRRVKAATDAGLSAEEFTAQEKLQQAITTAGDVLRFVTDQRLSSK